MHSIFKLVRTPLFERSAEKLIKKSFSVKEILDRMLIILEVDPLNLSRVHNIKKLTDIKKEEGQWRIRIGNYRLRYDISSKDVVLYSFNHRKNAY